ncbi:MAG: CDP-glycerol glycerophosphotransferase family protein [Candidatus Marinimicrobia bacterium]|jgi:CDP-glycerol glycerophosphotransferase (TagB/SpsB family)|nr:CDP-glycerol glycerophosphotransferase family protein [Candidatus Neomarinimicrobiota bacterium]|tara:strand:- start:114 stop:1301 length:1188 start_codon:yes stop_codon:yes gene_type:complete
MRSIKTIIISLIMFFVYWFSQLIPKKKKLWIFGAWNGEKYGDNTKFLFEYINNNKTEIRPVWLTRNQTAYDLIESKGFEVIWTYSIKGFLISMMAEKIFISVGIKDVNRYVVNRKDVIMMWHGGTPIKKIVFDDTITRNKQNLLEKLIFSLFPFLGTTHLKGLAISGSLEASRIFQSAFNAKEGQVLLTGFPRNDSFFEMNQTAPLLTELNNSKLTNVIYMPTHRKEGKGKLSELFNCDLTELNNSFKSLNSKLFIKLHYFHLRKHTFKNLSHVYFITDDDIEQDIYTVLNKFDILITDFSSVHFDYLLTQKPIIFAPFDKEKYLQNDREFYFNYDEVTPGPQAENWEEILVYIENFIHNPKLFEEERLNVMNRFNQYTDSQNCQRVFSAINNKN